MPPNICRSTKLVADTIDEKFDCASFNDIVESIFDFSDTPVQYRETQFIKIELPSIISFSSFDPELVKFAIDQVPDQYLIIFVDLDLLH